MKLHQEKRCQLVPSVTKLWINNIKLPHRTREIGFPGVQAVLLAAFPHRTSLLGFMARIHNLNMARCCSAERHVADPGLSYTSLALAGMHFVIKCSILYHVVTFKIIWLDGVSSIGSSVPPA